MSHTTRVPPNRPAQPLTFEPPYPNPFSATTTFTFSVSRRGHAQLVLYDVMGRAVSVLHEGIVAPGRPHQIRYTRENLATGMYLARLNGDGRTITRRLVHIH